MRRGFFRIHPRLSGVTAFAALPPFAAWFPAIACLLFAGCLPAPETGRDQPADPMHRCIGEPGYSASWEDILKDIEKDPPNCDSLRRDAETRPPEGGYVPTHVEGPSVPDSARIHTYVFDSQCVSINEFRDTVALYNGKVGVMGAWDFRDAEGRGVPTGEYYVNTAVEYADGSKDTSYEKLGIIADRCAH